MTDKSTSSQSSSLVTFQNKARRSVVLLDGRACEIKLSQKFKLSDYQGDHLFDFTWLEPNMLWGKLLLTALLRLLSTHSLRYACLSCYYSKRLFEEHGFDQNSPLTLEQISQFPQLLPINYWQVIQPLLKKIAELDTEGAIEGDLAAFLEQPQKWETKGKGAYFALCVNDPENGAFTEQELLSIHNGVNKAFEEGKISLHNYTLIWMLIGTGVRPVQLAKMTVSDVKVYDGPEGKEITLYVPLAKGQKAVVTEKWQRRCPSVVAEVLLAYLNSTSRSSDMALFADQSVKITNILRSAFEKIETFSERTEGPIHVTSYRFRYTLGTRAIAQGASDFEVARLLTHRTTWCVQYYRASLPDLQKPIQDALADDMSIFVDAFRGRLIAGPEQASRKEEPEAIIRDFMNLDGSSIGACGTNAECHQHAPVACLTCPKFEPFESAPWESLLNSLQSERSSEADERIKAIFQPAIGAVNEIINLRDAK